MRALVSQHPRVKSLIVSLVIGPALLCAVELVLRRVDALVVALRAFRLAPLLATNFAAAFRAVRNRHDARSPRAASALPSRPSGAGRSSSTGAKALSAEVEVLARMANLGDL